MENKTFSYTYSAKDISEIQKIRGKYISPTESGIDRLRKLDASVSHKASAYAIALGVIGVLLLGTGMSLAMTELAHALGMSTSLGMVLGIGIGVPGILLVALAYPLYNRIVKKERARIAPEILRLTDELLK